MKRTLIVNFPFAAPASTMPPKMVFEPVHHSLVSVLASFVGGFVPALLAPLFLILRPGRLRCVFWYWLLPPAPLVLNMDETTSLLRCRTGEE